MSFYVSVKKDLRIPICINGDFTILNSFSELLNNFFLIAFFNPCGVFNY